MRSGGKGVSHDGVIVSLDTGPCGTAFALTLLSWPAPGFCESPWLLLTFRNKFRDLLIF